MTDITDIKRALEGRAFEVAERLLPNGILEGREWCAGSTRGEPGKSLKVCVKGAKAGLWSDFAEGGESGDLIDLWQAVKGQDLTEALDDIRGWLGIERPSFERAEKTWRRPERPKCQTPKSAVHAYLTEERKVSLAAIRSYRVGEDDRTIVFPSLLPDGTLAAVKYLGVDRPAGKKVTRVEPGCEPVLFGWQAIDPNSRSVTLTEGECLTGAAEVLTPDGWVTLESYAGGAIAQWDEGVIQWVVPRAKIETPFDGDLIRFYGRAMSMTVTPGHRMPGQTKGKTVFVTAEEREKGRYKHHTLPRSGRVCGNGLGLTKDQIAFCLAIQADASVDVRKSAMNDSPIRVRALENRYARVTLFKGRKIDRMSGLLERLGLHHSRTENQISSGGIVGGVFFGIPLPEWVPGRILPWNWIVDATEDEREFIIDELTHWDGNSVPNRNQTEYASKYKYMADWVQALCHTTGRVSTIIHRSNAFGEWFKVSLLHGKSDSSYQSLNTERIPFSGKVYCVKVPSGAFLAREDGRVFVTGNCDALTAWDYGFPALSVPFGGGKGAKQAWIESEYDRLARFEVIYLALDMDGPGEEAVKEIVARLGRHRCRRVSLPHKDLNECRKAGVPVEQIRACFDAAKTMDPPELVRAGQYTADVIRLFWPADGDEDGFSLPWQKVAGKVTFRPGELTVWTGPSGSGKSQVLSHSSVAWGEQGAKVCIASLEMAPPQYLRRMCKQAGAVDRPTEPYIRDLMQWLDGWLWCFALVGKSRISTMLETFEYARCRYGCDVFVIDSLMRLGIGSEDYEGQEKAVYEIVNWAVEKGVHVHLVAHSRKTDTRDKGGSAPETEDIKGASEIGSNAFNIIGVWRNRKIEDQIKELTDKVERGDAAAQVSLDELKEVPPVIMNIAKQRNGDWEGKCGLWFDQRTYQYRSAQDARTPKRYVQPSRQDFREDAA